VVDTTIIIVALIAFIVAFAIGANDETSAPVVGSGALSLTTAVMLGALLNIIGAVLFGGGVAKTVGQSMIKERYWDKFNLELVLILLIAVSIWMIMASWFGAPMSTTQAVVGGIIGIGIGQLGGIDSINGGTLMRILISWVISPVIGFVVAYLTYKILVRYLLSRATGLRDRSRFEWWLARVTIIVVFLTQLSRGGNDVANAVAPLLQVGTLIEMRIALLIGGVGMALGLLVIGRKVLKELGQNLTNLTPSTAFSSALATSLIMFFGTRAGLPLSGTHVLVLSFVGVSYAAREKIKMETLKGIAISWGLTVPACAVLSGVCALAYFAIV